MIDIQTELGSGYHLNENNQIVCPFHEDTAPSCWINPEGTYFSCKGCGEKGSFARLIGKIRGIPTPEAYKEIYKSKVSKDPTLDAQLVEIYYNDLLSKGGPLLEELHRRGIDDETIRKRRLGAYNSAVAIPIYNEAGYVVNIRFHKPNAKANKVISVKGYGKTLRLYPIEQMGYDEILIAGGELKAIAAAQELNEHEIGVVCTTGGEGNWSSDFDFKGKKVYICMDIDKAGVAAAESVAKAINADWIGILNLPLDKKEFPKGDINDYYAQGQKIHPLLLDVEEWKFIPKNKDITKEPPSDLTLDQAVLSDYANSRIRLRVKVSSLDTTPYNIPKKVEVECARGEHAFCGDCPVYYNTQAANQHLEIDDEEPNLISMVGSKITKETLKASLGIPETCKSCDFVSQTFYTVEDARISPELHLTNRDSVRTMQSAFCIGNGLEANETYSMVGKMVPHPNSQQSCFLISNYETVDDALSTYELTNAEELTIFQPKSWTVESLEDKLNDIYEDLEANVTRIYQRRDFHLAVDLAYHSVLHIPFKEKNRKGTVEVIVVGDSSQGKSEATESLVSFYALGERVDCKGSSVAGLLGGLEKYGEKWFIRWGVIPSNDKRLVILEELKGASTELIASLTDMRSSGTAAITKIQRRETHARTRLIAISNPRTKRNMSYFNYGVEAIRDLIGSNEDVRRFDLGIIMKKEDIDVDSLKAYRPVVEHKYTADLCRELILYGWTCDKIDYEDERSIINAGTALTKEFTEDLPLVDKGSIDLKLARLCTALAVRTFSVEKGVLKVRKCHLDYIVDFIRKIYNSNSFGYGTWSENQRTLEAPLDSESIRRVIVATAHPEHFIQAMLISDSIDAGLIQDVLGLDRDTAKGIFSSLVRLRAILRRGAKRIYFKNPEFTALLKEMTEAGEGRPSYVGGE